MRETVTRQLLLSVAAGFAVAGAALLFPVAVHAQRPFSPVDGTDCLVVTGTAPTSAPQVLAGRQPLQESFGEGDSLYIGGPGVGGLTVGRRMQFVRGYGRIHHPDTGEFIADAIGWIGFAEVVAVNTDRAIVRVTKACREIQVGEYLLAPDARDIANVSEIPSFVPNRLIAPDPADPVVILGEIEALLSDTGNARVAAARDAYGQRDVVIINQGSGSGWAPGDLVDMYRDELALEVQTGATDYTPRPLALGLVVAVGENAAAVLVVEGNEVIEIGDRVKKMGEARD